MAHLLHHFHVRKRVHRKLEKYPHPDRLKRFLDRLIYFVVFAAPFATIPQVYKIWIGQDAAGVSLIAWFSYILICLVWLVYGILHKEKPIIFANTGYIIVNILVFLGTLIYG